MRIEGFRKRLLPLRDLMLLDKPFLSKPEATAAVAEEALDRAWESVCRNVTSDERLSEVASALEEVKRRKGLVRLSGAHRSYLNKEAEDFSRTLTRVLRGVEEVGGILDPEQWQNN
jgi:hypothetical protein